MAMKNVYFLSDAHLGSLAIEQNTLSLEQVTAVLNGKHVLAPPKDIAEVKNAYEI